MTRGSVHPALRPALLVVLVVLAGCAAPTAQDAGPTAPATTQSETTPPTVESSLERETPATGADALPVNASRVYDRVAASLDSDVRQPEVRTVAAAELGGNFYGRGLDPFHRLLLDADDVGNRTPAAYYRRSNHQVTVLLYDGVPADAANASELRAVLAHEFAHAVTYSDDRYRDPMMQAGGGGTTDASRIRQAMTEGSATFVSDEYSDRYLDGFDDGRSMARDYRTADEFGRYVRGPYRFGGRYFDRRLASPANLTRVFRSPPETTEQLVHGFAPGEEPPADLRVRVSTDENVTTGKTDTTGELFVRDVLGARLPERRAATAAAGWGNDRVVAVWNHSADESGQRNFVWALRWDDGRNATEFERTFVDYLDARGERLGDRTWRVAGEQFRLVRASDRTVVAVIGGPETVERAEISADDGEVSVTA